MKLSRVLTCAVAVLSLAACGGSQSPLNSTPWVSGGISGASFATSSTAHFSRFPAPETLQGSVVIGADNAVYLNSTHHFLKFNGTFRTIAYPSSGDNVYSGGDLVNALSRGPGTGGTLWTPLSHSAPDVPNWWTAGRLHAATGTADQSSQIGFQNDTYEAVYWGGDNNMWLTMNENSGCTNCNGVQILDVAFNNVGFFSTPHDDPVDALTKGPDNAMYAASDPAFRSGVTSKIYRFDSNTHNVTNTFALPAGSLVSQMTRGSDGALWFTDKGLNKIGRITTTGVVTYHTIPTANAGLAGITLASDNALWFTEKNANKIGRITTAGAVTEYSIPSPGSQPAGITAVIPHTPVLLYFSEANALGVLTF